MPRKRQTRRKKFEDKSDPERCRAFGGLEFPIKDADHRVEGKSRVWDILDGESIVLNIWHTGEITAYIEKVGE